MSKIEKRVNGWVQLIQLVRKSGLDPDEVAELISDRLHLELGNTLASQYYHEDLAKSLAEVNSEISARHQLAAEEDKVDVTTLRAKIAECGQLHTDGDTDYYGSKEELEELLQAIYGEREGEDPGKIELRFVQDGGCISFQGTIQSGAISKDESKNG